MSKISDTESLATQIEGILEATNDDIRSLAKTAGLDASVDFQGAELSGFDLNHEDLSGFNLVDTNLSNADLKCANLRLADLRRANLVSADLSEANLGSANLSSANLTGAKLDNVRGLESVIGLDTAIGLPAGILKGRTAMRRAVTARISARLRSLDLSTKGPRDIAAPGVVKPDEIEALSADRALGVRGIVIRPLGDRILVKRIQEEKRTMGGIIIPDTAREKPQEGKVVAVGKGRLTREGKSIAPDVKKGDRILFGKYAGSEVKIEGEEHLILREDDILGVLRN